MGSVSILLRGHSISCLILMLLSFTVDGGAASPIQRHTFVVEEASYTRLCNTKQILTVNGEFPGPTLYVHRGDTIIVEVINNSPHNVTLHWHGVLQPRNPWTDGPEYITQCPIQPGRKFNQRVEFSTEEGTLWWHAHSEWTRATVHGAIVVYPKQGSTYPFPKPHAEFPIIFGEWWNNDVFAIYEEFLRLGGDPNVSDAILINGQPGDLLPCSKSDTFRLNIDRGKTYLLRLVNAVLQDMLFFGIAGHRLTVVGSDGSYMKPFESDYISISPGQTIDVLLEAKPWQPSYSSPPMQQYYMAASLYSSNPGAKFDNTTATAILQYNDHLKLNWSKAQLPRLPSAKDTSASAFFTNRLRSLSTYNDPVPKEVTTKLFVTLSINILPCPTNSCRDGPYNGGYRIAASINNVSFVESRSMDILRAYYNHIDGIFTTNFPDKPTSTTNYTGDTTILEAVTARGTRVKVLEYDSVVEVVFQGTNLLFGVDHPMHLHGMSFYVVGSGFGNFDEMRDPKSYNLVDPPLVNTIAVPRNGWTVIRFRASNPGVWLMHCHLERHATWGMQMVFIVKNGEGRNAQLLPPPPDMPPC